MKHILALTAVAELATGLGLVLAPSLVAQLLLGAPLDGTAVAVARVAGLALVGLAVACWPGPPRLGMTVYSVAVAAYLTFIGVAGAASGVLLWPAVILHAALATILNVRPASKA